MTTKVQPLSGILATAEAVTTEIPKVTKQVPFNGSVFAIVMVPNGGPTPVCLYCGWMHHGSGTNLSFLTDKATEHWTEKHA